MEEKKTLWQHFFETGNPLDYSRYVEQKPDEGEDETKN